MRVPFFAAVLGAVVFSTGLASAQYASDGYSRQQDEQQNQGSPQRGGLRHFLTPELRAMWREQHRAEIRTMSADQRHAYKQQLRQQFLAMSDHQKAQMRHQLQEAWNQLPAARQQAIEQRLARRQQHRQGGQGRPDAGSYGPSDSYQGRRPN